MKIDTANDKEEKTSVKKPWCKPELQALDAAATATGGTTPNPESTWATS